MVDQFKLDPLGELFIDAPASKVGILLPVCCLDFKRDGTLMWWRWFVAVWDARQK